MKLEAEFINASIIDMIRFGASQFAVEQLSFGHSYDNAMDEAMQLVLHALHLPTDLQPAYGAAKITAAEQARILELFERRIRDRVPACYITGEAWFAGLPFKCDERALVPRSPIAELIVAGFQPWLADREVHRVLDLCTGGGSIGIATAHHHPEWLVDCVDLSDDALSLAEENRQCFMADNVRLLKSDLFGALDGEIYDLIVTNPPYVTNDETDALPAEYKFEPDMGLRAGADGLDLALKILRDAPSHLSDDGLLICEVGDSDQALAQLLPDLDLHWIEFQVGQMGVFVVNRDELVLHHAQISALCNARQ